MINLTAITRIMPSVRRDRSRRDWIELRLDSQADLDRVNELLAAAMAANA